MKTPHVRGFRKCRMCEAEASRSLFTVNKKINYRSTRVLGNTCTCMSHPLPQRRETCSRRKSVDGVKTGMLVGTGEHSREYRKLGGRLRTPIV